MSPGCRSGTAGRRRRRASLQLRQGEAIGLFGANSRSWPLPVEQNMRLAAQAVDRYYMLRAGQVVAQGPAAELERDYEHLAREYYL
ncbi:MAG TPA: hypothetical protein VEA17_17255 [Bordetella sp.]|nr:hypothetical protein [Bordetella sp.]